MRKSIVLLLLSLFLLNCASGKVGKNMVSTSHYEVTRSGNQKAVLVLFPCFPCDIEHTKAEARFLNHIEKQGITTILLGYNQKLFLKESEKQEYAAALNSIFDQHHIDKTNVFIGGFSGGGNVAMLLSSYLVKNKNAVQPKGLLVVDSPIDLEQLYHNAEKEVAANVDPEAVEEGKFLIRLLDKELGNSDKNPEKYRTASPYLMASGSVENIRYLKNIKTRFYCEPDLDWQQENKGRKFEDLNAFVLKKANETLFNLGSHTTEYIETKNRGIRANGKKHPHSWNIVEQEGLVQWMLE